MKTDWQNLSNQHAAVKQRFTTWFCLLMSIGVLANHGFAQQNQTAQTRTAQRETAQGETVPSGSSQPAAISLLEQVIDRLANGPAFDAKVRQRVWTSGREVVGVGTYTQAGNGTGAFSMQLSMHDGNGKHTLFQISDGRLAYTQTEIAGEVSLRRVDVASLDEAEREIGRSSRVRPSMRVGGPSEMLDTLRNDYDLRLGESKLDGRVLHVIMGTLKKPNREELLAEQKTKELPAMYPAFVNVFVTAQDDAESGVQRGLPIRIEHRSESSAEEQAETGRANRGALVSLLEFYSIRPIALPPIQKFRFVNQDASVTFVNETSRYAKRFGVRVSEKPRRRYR